MTNQSEGKRLAKQLRNVGPKMAQRMLDVGIDTPDALRAMGAQAAYRKMYQDGDAYGDFNAAYLYALGDAIRDRDWLQIPASVKADHLALAQRLQQAKKSANNKNNPHALD
ncbi:TfoX/Sxy family DNA transformation protein [Marinicella meishanensis]|uniref:TfoX/Sxy family DNA transformation protein n=1 Tax=Marinicella meishanensis TaxID=2873263 RepID=UPI001CBE3FB5|nr:TfoX/Sxy family DNA transformation protein [Marinicella sp. NBU2979]